MTDDRGTKSTGAGAEAAEGVHGANAEGARDERDKTSIAADGSGTEKGRKGSEPLEERGNEHRSGYGGSGGKPVTSSDQRESHPSEK